MEKNVFIASCLRFFLLILGGCWAMVTRISLYELVR